MCFNSMNNQGRKIRPQIVNINRNEPLFCPYNVKINTCSGNCNNIDGTNVKLCVPDVLMSKRNKKRYKMA